MENDEKNPSLEEAKRLVNEAFERDEETELELCQLATGLANKLPDDERVELDTDIVKALCELLLYYRAKLDVDKNLQ